MSKYVWGVGGQWKGREKGEGRLVSGQNERKEGRIMEKKPGFKFLQGFLTNTWLRPTGHALFITSCRGKSMITSRANFWTDFTSDIRKICQASYPGIKSCIYK